MENFLENTLSQFFQMRYFILKSLVDMELEIQMDFINILEAELSPHSTRPHTHTHTLTHTHFKIPQTPTRASRVALLRMWAS